MRRSPRRPRRVPDRNPPSGLPSDRHPRPVVRPRPRRPGPLRKRQGRAGRGSGRRATDESRQRFPCRRTPRRRSKSVPWAVEGARRRSERAAPTTPRGPIPRTSSDSGSCVPARSTSTIHAGRRRPSGGLRLACVPARSTSTIHVHVHVRRASAHEHENEHAYDHETIRPPRADELGFPRPEPRHVGSSPPPARRARRPARTKSATSSYPGRRLRQLSSGSAGPSGGELLSVDLACGQPAGLAALIQAVGRA